MNPKIVFAHPIDLHYSEQGGAVRYTIGLVNFFCDKGLEVTLLGVSLNKQVPASSKPKLRFVSIGGPTSAWQWYIYLVKLLVKLPFLHLPKSAIVHTCRLEFMLPFIAYYPKRPKVITLDRQLLVASLGHPRLYRIFGSAFAIIIRKVLQNVNVVITDNNTLRYYKKMYPVVDKKAVVLPTSFVNMETFKPMDKSRVRKEFGLPLDEKIVIFIGRIDKEKNVDFLVRSFAYVARKYSNSRLLLVGSGASLDYRNSLKELLHRLELTNVTFMGVIPHLKIPKILNCADVLALCSLSEGSPTVVREALACGIPVVTTKVGDVEQIVTSDSIGSIVELDEEKFARAMIRFFGMSSDEDQLERRRILELKGMDFRSVALRILEVYNRLNQR